MHAYDTGTVRCVHRIEGVSVDIVSSHALGGMHAADNNSGLQHVLSSLGYAYVRYTTDTPYCPASTSSYLH